MNDNKKKLYDALSADYDMGDFETFAADVEDSVKRRKLYDAISGEYDLGDFDSFSKQLLGTTTTQPAQAAQPKAQAAQPVVDAYGMPMQPEVSTIEDAPQVEKKPQTTQTATQPAQAAQTQTAQAQVAETTQTAAKAETPWTAEMMALTRQHHLKETGEDPITYMPRGYRTGKTGSDDELLAAWYNEAEDTRKQMWDKQAELDVADYKADRDAVYAEQGKWDPGKAKQWREQMMATYRIDPMQEIPDVYRATLEQKWGKTGSDEAVLAAWLNEKENIRQGQWNDQMQTQKQKYMDKMKYMTSVYPGEKQRQEIMNQHRGGPLAGTAAKAIADKRLEELNKEAAPWIEADKKKWTPETAKAFRKEVQDETWYDPYGEVPESYKEAATKQWGKKGSEDAYFAAWMNMTNQERQDYLHAEHIKELTEGENKERMQTIYERAKSRGNEAGEQMHETFFKGAWSPGQAQGAGHAFATWQAQQPTTHTMKAIDKANEIIEAYRNHQLDENFFAGAYKGMKDGLSDIDNWTGVYMAGEMQNLYAIADKMEKGEALTQDEEDFLDAQAYRLAIEASLAEDLGWGYKSGNTTGASIPFMLQMLASPVSVGAEGSINAVNKGFAAVGKRAIKKFGKTILRRTLAMPKGLEIAGKALNIAGKAAKPLSRIVGKVAGTRTGQLIGKGLKATALAAEAGVAQAFLFNSDKMAADAMERHLGNEMLAERANEQYGTNLIAKEGEEWVTAITKAVASMTAEQGSEYLGTTLFEPIGKMISRSGAGKEIGDLFRGISATTLMRAAKNSRAGAALRLMSQIKGSKVLDEIMGKAQWNGLFGEYLEELANGAVSVAIGDIEAEKFASAKHQAETVLGLAWTSGALGVLRGAQRVKMYAKAHRLLADTDRTAQLLFTHEDGTINQEMMQKWEEFKSSLEGKDMEGMRAELSRIMDDIRALAPTQGGMNIHRMRLLMDYMKGYAYLMGISSADNADEQELTAEQEQAETALAEGMTADTAEAQMDIVQALAESEKRLGEMLGTEDVDSWLDAMGETAEAQLEALHNDTTLPDETKQAAEQYLNDRLHYEGVRTMAEEEVESRVNSAMAEFDQNTNKDTGKLTEVKMKDESIAYVVGGSLEAGGSIYIRYADGRLVHTVASDIVEVLSDQQAQPVRDMMAEGVRRQAVAEIAARMQAEQQRRQAEATRHSIPADETIPADVIPAEESVPTESAVAATEEAAPVEAAVTEEAAPREDADYEAMTPEEAVDDLWARTQEDEEVMDGSIQDTIEQMQQRLAEAEAAPIAAGANMTERIANRQAHNAAVAQAKASLEHWQKIAAMAEQRKAERAAQTQEAEELNQQLERQRLQEEQARIEREQKAAEQKAHAEEVQANMKQYIEEAEAHNSAHDVREISRQTGVEAKRIKRILDWASEHGVKIDFENYTTTGEHGQGQMTNANIVSDKRRIVLNKGVLSDGTAIEFIAGHELTHQAKADGNMEAWENLRKATIEAMGQERYDREFERTKRLYRQAYKNMSEQELNAAIEEEVVADWSGMIFLDSEAIDKMRNVPKNFAQKVYTWLKGFFYSEAPKQVKDAISAWQRLAEGKELTGEAADREKHSIVGTTGARALDKAEGTTMRMDNMDVAEEMEAAGKDAETIWMATGWERGADGKWKYEVLEDFAYEEPRAKAERLQDEYQQVQNEKESIYRYLNMLPARGLTEQQKAIKKEQNARLKKLIRQGEKLQDEIIESNFDTTLGELIGTDNNIIRAYPELASMPVSFVADSRFMDAGLKGTFDGEGIWINPTLENTAPTLLHEVQHAIQRIEGFARGGNTGSVKTKADALREDVRPLHDMMLDTPEWAERQRLQNRWFDETDAAEIAKIEQRVMEINESGVLDAIQSKRKQLQEKYGSDATVGKILGSPYAEDAEIWQQLPESFNDKYEAYRSLAGETEARNVSARLNMSEEERRQTRPGKTEDVAREEQTVIYAEVSDKAGAQLEETANATRYSIVVDPQLIAELEASPKRMGYRNVVQREDGLFEAPMGNSLRGNGITVENTPFAMGQWEQSEEHPELVYGDNKITLVKPDGKTVADVNYNPYIHNRLNTLNAQFKQAWERPDLVYIETEVPVTDLEGGYMAEHAHLSTGVHQWSNGALMLSRYDKPVRIVPWDEVAIPWIEKYKKSGVHFDIVPPALRPILAEAGVEIKAPHNGMGENCIKAYEEWKAEQEEKKFSLVDYQGNPLNDDGTLVLERVSSIAELTDNDFEESSRSIILPKLPENVDKAIGAGGKDVIIKKNIFERNYIRHSELTPDNSREILQAALYSPNIYGQNQKSKRPKNWVVISVASKSGANKLVLLEISDNKEFVEIVHWHYIDQRGIEKIKRQAGREGGQLLILPSVSAEEVGALSDLTTNLSSVSKDTQSVSTEQTDKKEISEKSAESNVEVTNEEVARDKRFSIANRNQEIFVSNAARAVEGIKQEKATPQQWLAMIEKNSGLKAGEDKWLGLSDWLKGMDKKSITKQEILDFIEENMIQIEEVHYGENSQGGYEKLDEEILGLWREAEGNNYDKAEQVQNILNDRYDGFADAAEIWYDGSLRVKNEGALAEILREDRPINSTRLEYTTKGLENKREIALTVPTIEPWNKGDEIHFGEAGEGRAVTWVRFGETTDAEGKRVLVIDEIQSNRHQEGREKGYKQNVIVKGHVGNYKKVTDKLAYADVTKENGIMIGRIMRQNGKYVALDHRRQRIDFARYNTESEALTKVEENAGRDIDPTHVPDAPFDKNWHELAMKRMLRLAAEEGFDKVAWTTGAQQAERYDIGNVVNRIESNDTVDYDSTLGVDLVKQVVLFTRYGNAITLHLTPEGIVRASSQYNGHHISDIVGKELGNRIMAETDLVLKEQDLRIGGEGMKGFYDKMLPSFMNKYGKKWGAKVGEVTLPDLEESAQHMWAVDVTPEMKESVMQGQVMFSLSTEEQSIVDAAKANGTYMKAPNGEPTNLNEKQWAQVRTKAFKEWFGDWENDPENASKVVDENGEPRVMYHGSSWRPLQEEEGNAVFKMQDGALGKGAYFTSSFPEAADYVRDKLDNWDMSEDEIDEGGYVTEVFLNIRDDKQILRDNAYGNDSFIAVATSHTQIKSATDNVGTFDAENADIRYSINNNNVAGHIYSMDETRAWMWALKNAPKGVLAKGYGYIDKDRLEEFKDWYDSYLEWAADEYVQALIELKAKATKKAQEYIDEVIAGVEKHKDDFRRLAEGDNSVLSLVNNARFSITPDIIAANERFNEELDEFKAKTHKGLLHLGKPGAILRTIGVDADEMTLSPSVLSRHLKKHNLTTDDLIGLPLSVQTPILAYRHGDKNPNLVVVTEMDVKGGKLSVSLELDENGHVVEIDNIRSVHSKDATKEMARLGAMREGELEKALRWVEKEEVQDWLGIADLNRPIHTINPELSSVANVLLSFQNPPIIEDESSQESANAKSGEQNKRSFSITAEPSFEKWKDEQPRYSLAPISGRGVNESFMDYANRVAREVERQRSWQRMGLNRVLARDQYEKRVASGWYQTQEALQDSMLGLKALMESIAGKGIHIEDIPDFENPYLGENRLSSVNQAESEMFARMFIKPMLEEIAKLARNEQERDILTNYAMAKHGLERNLMMATRDAQKAFADPNNTETLLDLFNKFRKKDYAGLTGLTGKDTVAAAEQEAQQMVDDYEQAHNTDELWKKIDAVNDAILLKQKECGLLGEKMYKEIRAMYDYYIPLRGFDEETIVDAYAYLDNKAMGEGSVVQRAQGRTSKADNPWAYLQSMADQTIMQGNRNKLVKEKLLTFVTNHPSDAVSLSRVWMEYDPSDKRWYVRMPKFLGGETSEQVAAAWEELDREISELAEQHPDLYKTGKESLDLPFKVPDEKMLKEHQVLVRTGAGLHIITINGSPRAAQAVNGQTNPDKPTGTLGAVVSWLEGVNRFMSQMYTSSNPDFIYSNWIRDSIYGNSMMWVKESPAYARRFNANWAKYNPNAVRRLLIKYKEGTLNMNNYTEALFNDFMMNGGETGYSIVHDIEAHKTAIKKEMQKLSGDAGTREAIGALLEKMEDISRAVENATRFAAFVTSMEEGRGIGRSIWDAKEVSVNFNKKGAGDKFWKANGQTKAGNAAAFISGLGRMAYVFWNAALQGTTNTGRQVKRHPVKALSALAVSLALGYLAALAGTWDGDDDEEKTGEKELGYLDLPEYTRRSNMVIKTVKGHWLTIPLPIEYRALYGLGELAGVLMSGKQELSGGDIAMAVLQQLAQVLPVDMLSGKNGWLPFVPSALSPLAQVLSNNKWTGQSLWYEPEDKTRAEVMPEWAKAYKGTDRYLVALTKGLSNVTGGDDVQGGWLDLNPAAIETLLDGHFGAISTMSKNLVKSIEMAAGVREYDPRYIPIWRRMVAAENEQTQNYSVNADYRELKETYDEMLLKMRDYQKAIDNGREDYEEKLERLEESDERLVYDIFEDNKDDLKTCTEDLREAEKEGDEEEIEEAKAALQELKRKIVDEVRAARKQKEEEKKKKKEESE